MLEIAAGILLALGALAVLFWSFRYVLLALSAVVSLAIIAGAWLLLAWGIGPWGASGTLVGGVIIWVWSANRDSGARETSEAKSREYPAFGAKRSPLNRNGRPDTSRRKKWNLS